MRPLLIASVVAIVASAQPAPPALTYRQDLLIQLGVADLDRAITFYTKTLGFKMTERRDDLKFAHISTNVAGLEIGLNQIADPKGTGSAVLNIGVVDVVAARKTLEGRGVVFRGETVIIPGKVALAQFADPDGNVLRFAGPPPKVSGQGSGIRDQGSGISRLFAGPPPNRRSLRHLCYLRMPLA